MDNTEEMRVTLGNYERDMVERGQWISLVKGLALPAGIAAVGLGAFLAAVALTGMLGDWLKSMKGLLSGADSEKRDEVNKELNNTPANPDHTPDRWAGMSAPEIYSLMYDKVSDIDTWAYEAWLSAYGVESNGRNWAQYQANGGVSFQWGDKWVKMGARKVAHAEAENTDEDAEVDYTGFAYQMAIRETATRRWMIHDAGNLATNLLQGMFGQMGGLEWTSRKVSEAPGYVSDPLLWTAYARVQWGTVGGLAGVSPNVQESHYWPNIEKSFGWEEEAYDLWERISEAPTSEQVVKMFQKHPGQPWPGVKPVE